MSDRPRSFTYKVQRSIESLTLRNKVVKARDINKEGPLDTFEELVASLTSQTNAKKKVLILRDIADTWELLADKKAVGDILQESNLLPALTVVLRENEASWTKDFPKWIRKLIRNTAKCSMAKKIPFPKKQFEDLYTALKTYVKKKCWDSLYAWSNFACFTCTKELFVEDDELYQIFQNIISKEIVQWIFCELLVNSHALQQKVMQDTNFVRGLLSLPENIRVWNMFSFMAKHPDARTYLSEDVLVKARQSATSRAFDICVLLCDDEATSSATYIKWLAQKVYLLHSILTTGDAYDDSGHYTLEDLLLPITRLSSMESRRGELGNQVITQLMEMVTTTNLPKILQRYVPYGRQEASRALRNLASLEANRVLIAKDDGITKLNIALATTNDAVLAEHITDIISLFTAPSPRIAEKPRSNSASSPPQPSIIPESNSSPKSVPRDLIIDVSAVFLNNKIGDGSYGEVWKGVWGTVIVAVKKLLIQATSPHGVNTLESEILIAAKLRHPSVISMYGACAVGENEIWIVMEYAEGGSLFHHLADHYKEIPWSVRWKWATQAAASVVFLHGKHIIHRDIKSLNFLLVKGELKITDFGMSTVATSSTKGATSSKNDNATTGTARWLAPETTALKPVNNEKSDVYSLGMVLWEIASRQIPFHEVCNNAQVIFLVKYEHARPDMPDCPENFASIIKKCWEQAPDARPTATEAYTLLCNAAPKIMQLFTS